MELFIDKLPIWQLSVRLPVMVTEPGLPSPPSNVETHDWVVDTGFSGDAFAWKSHLQTAGIDPDVHHYHRLATLRSSAFGGIERLPMRRADLWLSSNLVANSGRFYCLPIDEGIVFRDEEITESQQNSARPLIGMRLLRRARLKLEIDFASSTFSVWVPGA